MNVISALKHVITVLHLVLMKKTWAWWKLVSGLISNALPCVVWPRNFWRSKAATRNKHVISVLIFAPPALKNAHNMSMTTVRTVRSSVVSAQIYAVGSPRKLWTLWFHNIPNLLKDINASPLIFLNPLLAQHVVQLNLWRGELEGLYISFACCRNYDGNKPGYF